MADTLPAVKITNDTRSLVAKGMRDTQTSQAALAKKLGVSRSWMTKFFKGTLLRLSEDHILLLEEALQIQFATLMPGNASKLAEDLAEQIQKGPDVGTAIASIIDVLQDDHYYDLPILPTKDLVDFGKEILRASHEDPDKPGKIGKIAMIWLTSCLQRLKP